ncbi:PREDICTED: arginyl aminopeptidase-like 1 [Bison bison bison]|uniref:Arginyl aminopeptidase-like 1 n=1 Tax=Bison bison bison TaxID=43346 RepID=A0A6P3HCF3_BISBB|nr:PREDICTED: arginyl aminopeptidase-like 1 [Bison bison bison]
MTGGAGPRARDSPDDHGNGHTPIISQSEEASPTQTWPVRRRPGHGPSQLMLPFHLPVNSSCRYLHMAGAQPSEPGPALGPPAPSGEPSKSACTRGPGTAQPPPEPTGLLEAHPPPCPPANRWTGGGGYIAPTLELCQQSSAPDPDTEGTVLRGTGTRCASLALPCLPGPCCLSAWPLLSASLALALPPLAHHLLQIWWLDPELTYGSAKPFVFTQGHSVCNRSFFPCFDTPAVKCTYSAVVKVSAQQHALPPSCHPDGHLRRRPGVRPASEATLSGPAWWGQPCPCLTVTAQGPSSPGCSHPGALCWSFWAVPLQANLLRSERACGWARPMEPRACSRAVGGAGRRRAAFTPRSRGKARWGRGLGLGGPAHRLPHCRSRVWAEPCLLPTATSKLSGAVEQWLSAAERLYGPYLWGRYDIVFLPPSFPIVAMENPCLTFIISSILESDEFLVIDVIHEVAHSWFGNAVTNATWEEMWLSEGLATYAQRRITTETHGAAFTCLETAFRLDALHRQMKLLGEDSPVSKLQVKLEPGVNPSHLMNLFTYEKGYCFVYYLSQLCGDPQRFDDFLRAYVEKYKFTSVVAQDLLDSFLAFFPELKEQSVDCRAGLEFERWLNATGPPLAEPDLSQGSSLTRPVEALFQLWTAEPLEQAAASASAIDISKWRTFQTALFLDRLLDGSPLPQDVVMSLSKCYSSLLDSMNAEIRIRWLQIVVRNDYYPDLHRVRRFLESQVWPRRPALPPPGHPGWRPLPSPHPATQAGQPLPSADPATQAGWPREWGGA